ncbi:uncharacterized protein HMPREF1541_10943 [Cyphellophora europaea CBS 101466]|uniref:Uncharacterized protein n=1 Tax=Cyphellophora europaea (strain CBS 101466) TaxID=1220924 RepID=W2S7Q3_CYPE1|nr:uncharacterized protein HMPREF1541_10943 [Cyphellophora europaea CBS 101466]ETN44078.1 hypothetical protein HMPREF1541_10943 [Cyphellophora europaea CBS 101466]
MLHHWRSYLLAPFPSLRASNTLHNRHNIYVYHSHHYWQSCLGRVIECTTCYRRTLGHIYTLQHNHHWTSLLLNRHKDTVRSPQI